MPCSLCLKEEPLKEELVLPAFLDQSAHDETRGFCFREGSLASEQTQVMEALLCRKCSGKLGKHANYAAYLLEKGVEQALETRGSMLLLRGIDYSRFKLFQLTLLWKASISRHPVFEKISLGPHQEKIRKMLLNDEPGTPDEYGCLVVLRPTTERATTCLPARIKFQGNNTYRFGFGEFYWSWIVSTHFDDAALKAALMTPYQFLMLTQDFIPARHHAPSA